MCLSNPFFAYPSLVFVELGNAFQCELFHQINFRWFFIARKLGNEEVAFKTKIFKFLTLGSYKIGGLYGSAFGATLTIDLS